MKKSMKTVLAATMMLQFIQLPVLAEEEMIEEPVVVEEEIYAEETIVVETNNGWKQENGNWYYYDGSTKKTGWIKDGGTWYYLASDGKMVSNQRFKIDGATYNFNENGAMIANKWVATLKNEKKLWRYYDASGAEVHGWKQIGGVWYYFQTVTNFMSDGIMVSGMKYTVPDYGLAYFNDDGVWVKTGWLKMNGEWYYVENNKLVSGWKKVGTKWYYLDPEDDNKMAADTDVYSDDNWYYLCSDGAMACNQWVNKGTSEEPDWYYYGANGLGYDGWLLSGGKWYYLNGGYMCADDIIEEDNGDLYYLGKDGAMCTNGWCLYTWRDDSYHEDWIYASSNGKLVKANWVGDYYLRASGTMVRGAYIYNSSNGKYYWVDEETGKYDPSKTTTEKPSVWYIDVIDQKTGKYIDD